MLHRVKEEINNLDTITSTKANLIGDILCRDCFLKHVILAQIEGRIHVT